MKTAILLVLTCAASIPAAAQPQKASISGQAVSTAGQPVRKADVRLVPFGKPVNQGVAVATDMEGNFQFQDLDPGLYQLSAQKASYLQQNYGARRPAQPGSPVRLSGGQELRGIELKLTEAGGISGRAFDEDGEPFGRFMAMAFAESYVNGRKQWIPRGTGTGNDRSQYSIGDLPPGKYLVGIYPMAGLSGPQPKPAEGPEQAYTTTYFQGTTDLEMATPVEVGPGAQLTALDITMRKRRVYRVRGRVGEGGSPAAIIVYPMGQGMLGLLPAATVTPSGPERTFEVSLAPGAYRVTGLTQVTGGGDAWVAEVAVTDQDLEGLVLAKPEPLSVSGKLLADNAGPSLMRQIQVRLIPEEVSLSTLPVTPAVAEDGTFTAAGLARARYTVTVSGLPPSAFVKRVRVAGQDAADRKLDLTGGVAPPVEITISGRAASLAGTVKMDDHNLLPAARVVLVPESDSLRKFDFAYASTTSRHDGTFEFLSLAPGRYKLLAWEDIDTNAWLDPDVLAKYEARSVSISLSEGDRQSVAVDAILSPDITPAQREQERLHREELMKPAAPLG